MLSQLAVLELLHGLMEMLKTAEAIAAHLNALAEGRKPEHSAEEVAEWSEDLAADIYTVQTAIAKAHSPAPSSQPTN